jgi:hypothetical protein
MIRTLRRVSGVLPLTRWLTDPLTAVVVFVALTLTIAIGFTSVHDAIHSIVALAVSKVVVNAEARAAACTATLALVVSRERIPTCKSPATFEASMRAFARVEFRVAFQIMQTAETCLARGAFIRLFLAVRE